MSTVKSEKIETAYGDTFEIEPGPNVLYVAVESGTEWGGVNTKLSSTDARTLGKALLENEIARPVVMACDTKTDEIYEADERKVLPLICDAYRLTSAETEFFVSVHVARAWLYTVVDINRPISVGRYQYWVEWR